MSTRPVRETVAGSRVCVARIGDLCHGQTRKFSIFAGKREVEAFLICWHGQLRAYLNRCRHVPATLDWVEGRFLSRDGRYLQCATHGALYDPATGHCLAGPPCGKHLYRVPLVVEDGKVYASVLPRDPSDTCP